MRYFQLHFIKKQTQIIKINTFPGADYFLNLERRVHFILIRIMNILETVKSIDNSVTQSIEQFLINSMENVRFYFFSLRKQHANKMTLGTKYMIIEIH